MTASSPIQLIQRSRRSRPAFRGSPRFERTHDMDLVRKILTHPTVYRSMAEEQTGPATDFFPPDLDAIWYVLAYDAGELLGCYILIPENSVCWSIHLGLYPAAAWVAGRTVATTKAVFAWIWAQTECQRITAKIPAFNRLALHLAEKAQMIGYGRNIRSFPRFGELHDEILMGLSRPGVK